METYIISVIAILCSILLLKQLNKKRDKNLLCTSCKKCSTKNRNTTNTTRQILVTLYRNKEKTTLQGGKETNNRRRIPILEKNR